ncbi:MAG: DUF4249 domain-containing protein [Bacteroidota bacterium]
MPIHPLIFILLTLGAGGWVSCVESVSLQAPDEVESLLIVNGSVTAGVGRQIIHLGESQRFGNTVPIPQTGAKVEIVDEDGSKYAFEEEEEGVYTWYNIDRPIIVGDKFFLQFTLTNGNQYQSDIEEILPAFKVKDIRYEVRTDEIANDLGNAVSGKYVDVFIDIDVSQSERPVFLRWETDNFYKFREVEWPKPPCDARVYPSTCYIHDGKMQPEEVLLFDSRDYARGIVENIWVGRKRLDSTFNQLGAFLVQQKVISQPSFEFWEDVSSVITQSGDIFDAPPAAVRGNVFNVNNPGETVLGFFEAVNIDSATALVFTNDLAPNSIPPACKRIWWRPCDYYAPCMNCWMIPNSSYERPSFMP